MTEAGSWNGCIISYAHDPDGHTIEFIQRPTTAEPAGIEQLC